MIIQLKLSFILILLPFLSKGQNKQENIDSLGLANFQEFSIKHCFSEYKLDSNGSLKITSDEYSPFFKVNKGNYVGKISKEKLEELINLLVEFKILRFDEHTAKSDARRNLEIMDSGSLTNYSLKLKHKTITFTSISVQDQSFYNKLHDLLCSKATIDASQLLYLSNTDSSGVFLQHNIIEQDNVPNVALQVVIGRAHLMKNFIGEKLYSIKVDSICSHKSTGGLSQKDTILFISSKKAIATNSNQLHGLILKPVNLIKSKHIKARYYKVIGDFNPLESNFFEFYKSLPNTCYNRHGDIFKTGSAKHSKFTRLEKTVIKLKSK